MKTFDEMYMWLRDNAGNWSCNPDPSFWIRDGEKKYPRVHFTAYGVDYCGKSFEEALCLAMEVTK